MNAILLSFLYGAAFLGGAATVLLFIVIGVRSRDHAYRDELTAYWSDSLAKHAKQLELLAAIATALQNRRSLSEPEER